MLYPNSPSSFPDLLKLSARYTWASWLQIFFLIVIFVAIKALYVYLPAASGFWQVPLALIMIAAVIFLFVVALCRVDARLKSAPLSWSQTWQLVGKRMLNVYLACLAIIITFVVIFLVGRWLIFSLLSLTGAIAGVTMMIVIGIPFILLLVFSYLTIPILGLQPQPWWHAIYYSVVWTQRHFLPVIFLYVLMLVLMIAASPATRHGQWLLSHHLLELCDLVIFSVILPFFVNITLFLLHDIQLKSADNRPL